MTFIELLKTIRGLKCRYNNGMCRVEEVYWETDRVLIHLDAGVTYWAGDVDGGMRMQLISDGFDRIVIPINELAQQNPTI